MAASRTKQVGVTTSPGGSWVQIERRALQKWSILAAESPRAASVMMVLVAQMGRHNAIIASQSNLARMAKCSIATFKRAIALLREDLWLDVRQIGPTGTACAYIINDRVAWTGARDGIRYSLFSAAVLLSSDDQPDHARLGQQEPLERIPTMFQGERQLPTGPGIDPPFQPSIEGLEPDLPAKQMELEDAISLDVLRNAKVLDL